MLDEIKKMYSAQVDYSEPLCVQLERIFEIRRLGQIVGFDMVKTI